MRTAVFSSKAYDRATFTAAQSRDPGLAHELTFLIPSLSTQPAALAAGFPAVCLFVNDVVDRVVLTQLAAGGTRVVALRCAGFNNVDLVAASELGLAVVRVPAYSPYSVAEHAITLMLGLNRKLHRAYNRVREGNFALDGLLGFDVHGKTVGVVGTGKIGAIAVRILTGFGCTLLAYDPQPNAEVERLGARYVPVSELFAACDIISLHAPLTPQTRHLIDAAALARMKRGVMLINTSRGALVDARAAIDALKTGQLGALGLDVYEEEAELFFEDLSSTVICDDVFARLLTFPNVIITGHQAFFTAEALAAIAETTLANLGCLERGVPCPNLVTCG